MTHSETRAQLIARITRVVLSHYLKTGTHAFALDISKYVGVTREHLDQIICYSSIPGVHIIRAHNPATSPDRERDSFAYLPTLDAMRSKILSDKTFVG